tara:strand:+ start:172 stop:510 length:339 start_codon:yes stop_codon:yes gene_type:complete
MKAVWMSRGPFAKESTMDIFTIEIPKRFYIDHQERDLESGKIIKELATRYRCECTADDLREWLSDAEFYSDCASAGWSDPQYNLGLQSSARATAARVRALMVEHHIAAETST